MPLRNHTRNLPRLSLVAAFFLLLVTSDTQAQDSKTPWGRSHHGQHFDKGPRSKPWKMEGIGETHFPITSKHPEAQAWFDQGNTLLHGFWEFEAERSFRWCLKLDPDCAMAYWGLARCVRRNKARKRSFFQEAVKRKDKVSQRERDYIELWEAKFKVKDAKKDERKKAIEAYLKKFDNLLIRYPKDIEARALYWVEVSSTLGQSGGPQPPELLRYGMERILQEVLNADPDHVGALHYRVHNWDGEEGHYAVDSCRRLTSAAPRSGHLQHMPGHVLGGIGKWNEAAIAMDTATRVEKAYMRKRMVLPENNWDYIHNLDYLSYIQEQLGLFQVALDNNRQLLKSPQPQSGSPLGSQSNWMMGRLLVKYERWDDILQRDEELFDWSGGIASPVLRSYLRTHALIGVGKLREAEKELQSFQIKMKLLTSPFALADRVTSLFQKKKDKGSADGQFAAMLKQINKLVEVRDLELQGKLATAQGDRSTGLELLTKAAEKQYENWMNDPPLDPVFLYNTLGEHYLQAKDYEQAEAAFKKTLTKVIEDGFALSGLVVAQHALDKQEKAAQSMQRLLTVWRDAEPNRWLTRAQETGVKPTKEVTTQPERSYKQTVLDRIGPSVWNPMPAPKLHVVDANGQQIRLKNFRGKNVILIFYLGGQCVHCMEQIQAAHRMADTFDKLNTEIVAISKDDPETLKGYQADLKVKLLSDPSFSNARRYHSYDDFEEIELHSTVLIDSDGKIHWAQNGGAPFKKFGFLVNEVQRLNRRHQAKRGLSKK